MLIIGVRSDLAGQPGPLQATLPVNVRDAIADLPSLRSTLSREPDSQEAWAAAIISARGQAWFEGLPAAVRSRGANALRRIGAAECALAAHSSSPPGVPTPAGAFMEWVRDERMDGTSNHHARGHMRRDLWRYLFVASFGRALGASPHLRDFPPELLPDHVSAGSQDDGGEVPFGDRFRVQLADRPATTVVSHISRDGHYYIHYDAAQCRSLTVREAARLQSFPDNYFFEGNRTQQYQQVGNAVPPLLAHGVARTVAAFLSALPAPPADDGAGSAVPSVATAHRAAGVDPGEGDVREIRRRVRRWGAANYRPLPWRTPPAPFFGLVAEVMLQRTRAASVVPIYERFVERYPTPRHLADADPGQLEALMRPLGLLWRVPLLRALGAQLAFEGRLPLTLQGLLALPGVGPYAAAAFLSFHGGVRGVLLDSNVVRWLARLTGRPFNAETRRKRWVRELAERITPQRGLRAFNFALLDFTMTVCAPGRPRCEVCPLGPTLCQHGRTVLHSSRRGRREQEPQGP